MSKFKVGDKVAYATKPDEKIGEVNCVVEDKYGCHIFVAFNEKKVYEMQLAGYNYDEDKLVKIDETALSDDEIYSMLKLKMDNAVFSGVIKFRCPIMLNICEEDEVTCYQEADVAKAIALAYRSGYLRAKKCRPFKIGGDKE